MNDEKQYNVEVITEKGTYGGKVSEDVLQLMFNADIVTLRGQSVRVSEIEVTDEGITKFHGNSAEI
ncbi:MAG TPA: hypothetical protein VEY51_20875 [Chondromyces sp.]|nr:hypothetical protein [Chondromyces sp.]